MDSEDEVEEEIEMALVVELLSTSASMRCCFLRGEKSSPLSPSPSTFSSSPSSSSSPPSLSISISFSISFSTSYIFTFPAFPPYFTCVIDLVTALFASNELSPDVSNVAFALTHSCLSCSFASDSPVAGLRSHSLTFNPLASNVRTNCSSVAL